MKNEFNNNSLILCIFSLFLISTSTAFSQSTRLKFKHLSSNEGLPNNSINCITKDNHGFIWLGTEDGVFKYDAYEFTSYFHDSNNKNTIANNYCLCIYEDKNKDIWIGDQTGLSHYNPKDDNFTRYLIKPNTPNGISPYSIYSIFEDSRYNLWIGTSNGVFQFDREKKKFIPCLTQLKTQLSIKSITEDKDGNLWLANNNESGGLIKINKKNEYSILKKDPSQFNSLSDNNVNCLFIDSRKNLWVGTEYGGLDKYDPIENKFIHYDAILKPKLINQIAECQDGKLWIASQEGLYILDPVSIQIECYTNIPDDPNSILNDNVNTIFVDDQQTVWIGSRLGGIDMYNPINSKFKHIKAGTVQRNGLNSNTISTFAQDSKGNLWIATDGGGLNLWNKETELFCYFKSESTKNTLSNNKTLALAIDKEDILWAGMWNGGISKFKIINNELHPLKKYAVLNQSSNKPEAIFKILISKQNEVWAGTWKHGLFLYQKEKDQFAPYLLTGDQLSCYPNKANKDKIREEFKDCTVDNIMEDSRHRIWIATEGLGIFVIDRLTHQTIHYQSEENDNTTLSSKNINCIFEDSKKRIWVGTAGGGLNLLDLKRNTFTKYTLKDGLPNNNICGIQEDESGNIWVSTNIGISKISISGKLDQVNIKCQNYNLSDGLQGNQFIKWASFKDKNGQIYFGGSNGFNVFHPNNININKSIPQVYITDFYILNKKQTIRGKQSPLYKSLQETKEIRLNYNQKVFTIKFAALNYINSAKNRYAYKLVDFDKNWYYVDNREVTYTNLDPGEYTFVVKAANNDGIWNENGCSMKIIILPPWWKTWWFYTFIGLLLALISFVFYYTRVSRLEKQKKMLEKRVKERTSELERTNKELHEVQAEMFDQNEEMKQMAEEMVIQRDSLYEQNEKVTQQNNFINSSVRYALTIQQAILPPSEALDKLFQNFIIYRPKDVVSGDFYWISELKSCVEDTDVTNTCLIVVADCTGHGVPGAFMSMIGSRLISEIVYEKKIISPCEMLEVLDQSIVSTLRQDQSHNSDGMDISICLIKRKKDGSTALEFSGAKQSLLFLKKETGKISRIKGDHRTIGGVRLRQNKEKFTCHHLELLPNDLVYMLTDGVIDQNDPNRNRIGTLNFVAQLEANQLLSMQDQQTQLETFIEKWQNGEPQRDDITILGLKLG